MKTVTVPYEGSLRVKSTTRPAKKHTFNEISENLYKQLRSKKK
jgi:hypothetical protein